MPKMKKTSVGRRGFLKGAAAGAAALVTTTPAAIAQRQTTESAAATGTGAPAPTPEQLAREAGNVRPPAAARTITHPGSDAMVQTIKDLGIEFVAANPGSSFEGLQESLINYGNPPNQTPEFITALHEESSVGMAHGYAKATGKPMIALLHGTLGLQHGSMAMYNAFHDRVPILMIAGNDPDFIPAHTAHDMAGMVRSFTKWDAQPKTLDEALVAIQRAYNEAITPPMAPTLVVLDTDLQKNNAPGAKAPAYKPPQYPMVDATHAKEIAKGLVEARNPRIAVGRLRTPEGVRLSVELAELVGASTSTAATNGPMSFPQRHRLCGPGADTSYDYTLGLELPGAQVSITNKTLASIKPQRDPADIGFGGLDGRSRFDARNGDRNKGVVIEADAEASLPLIIEEAKRLQTADRKTLVQERIAKHATANHEARVQSISRAVEVVRAGWNGSPISTGAPLRRTLAPH